MSYNYLELVNRACRKVNEVELQSSNFDTTVSFYRTVKDAVNRAIQEINRTEFFWRFNFTQETLTLVPGQMRYSLPSSSKVIDFDSFLIKEDEDLGNETRWLKPLNYDEFNKYWRDKEFSVSESSRQMPHSVVKTPGNDFVVVPNPDKAYTLLFDYYAQPTKLENWNDVPNIPERYDDVIFHGTMRDVYSFREDQMGIEMSAGLFAQGIKDMRLLEVNLYDYVRSGMIVRDVTGNAGTTHV